MGIKVLACALPLIACASAATAAPRELTRTDKWNVNYDDDSCSLFGVFGADKQQIIIRLQWFDLGDAADLTLIGRVFASDLPRGSITVDFGPNTNPHPVPVTYGNAGKQPMAIASSVRIDDAVVPDGVDPPRIDPAYAATVDWLDLAGGGRTTRLRFTGMGAAMAAVRDCRRNLIAQWGYDPAVLAAASRNVHPTASPATWLRSGDYPTGPLLLGQNGIVHVRLDVDEGGAVKGCHILMKFNNPAFDKVTCDLLSKRARFTPALDSAGRPMRSFYVNSVHWVTR